MHSTKLQSKSWIRYTSQEKFEYTLLLISGAKTMKSLNEESWISPDTLVDWKKKFIKNGSTIFEKPDKKDSKSVIEKDLQRKEKEVKLLKKLLNHYKSIQASPSSTSPDTS